MSRSMIRQVVMAVLLTLAASWSHAGERQSPAHQSLRLSQEAWNEPASKLFALFSRLWAKAGCMIDPHGGCSTNGATTPPAETEVGCGIDPHGGCGTSGTATTSAATDEGCMIDPHGGCGNRK
jgi:hypothetical protein